MTFCKVQTRARRRYDNEKLYSGQQNGHRDPGRVGKFSHSKKMGEVKQSRKRTVSVSSDELGSPNEVDESPDGDASDETDAPRRAPGGGPQAGTQARSMQEVLLNAFADEDLKIIMKVRMCTSASMLRLQGGMWMYGDRMYVPVNMKPTIQHMAHDVPSAAHQGQRRMTSWIIRDYWWPRVRQDVQAYTRSFDSCQRVGAGNVPPAGLLQPLPIPDTRFAEVTMDRAKRCQYLVQWLGYGPEHDSWVLSEVMTCPEQIEEYHQARGAVASLASLQAGGPDRWPGSSDAETDEYWARVLWTQSILHRSHLTLAAVQNRKVDP